MTHAEEFSKANPQDIVDLRLDFHNIIQILGSVHGSNVGSVRLKVVFDENQEYDYKDLSLETIEILTISFSIEHKKILPHLYLLMNKGYLAIPPEYDKLISSLRSAYAREYTLDQYQISYDDLLDALRLSLKDYDNKN